MNGVAMKNNFLEEFELRRELQKYQKAIKLDPNNAGPFNGIANAYSGLEDFDKAIEYYQKAIKIDPSDASTWFYLGSAYLTLERHDEALAVFKEALKIHKENPFIMNGISLARYKLKKLNKPVNRLKTVNITKNLIK